MRAEQGSQLGGDDSSPGEQTRGLDSGGVGGSGETGRGVEGVLYGTNSLC